MALIKPRLLKGFRDYLPEKMIFRQKMMETIKSVYQRFGFLPLETPAIEYADILLGKYGNEGEKLLYHFKDNGGRDVALKYDLTVPLARVVAQYQELPKPIKVYQMAPVWRAENPQKGRYREFYQCDADIVGTKSLMADAECIALMSETLKALAIENFIIFTSNRKILNGILKDLEIPPEKYFPILRIIDRLDKVGEEKTLECLFEEIEDAKKLKKIMQAIKGKGSDEICKEFPSAKEGVDELENVIRYAKNLGVEEKNCKINLSVVRGLDYYTGTVFETKINDLPNIGSVFSGGRYDDLIGRFIGRSLPAVGTSIGLDRLFAALEELKLTNTGVSPVKIMIANLEDDFILDYQNLATKFRQAGINTIIYFDKVPLTKQLSYASELKIPFVLIFGSKEKEKGIYVLKNMDKQLQEELNLEKIIARLN